MAGESKSLHDASETKRFVRRLVEQDFSGFVDFDQSQRKRRYFFGGGKLVAAQSAVAGENLCDFLVSQGAIKQDSRDRAMKVIKEKKISAENALLELSLIDLERLVTGIGRHADTLLRKTLAEGGQVTATDKPLIEKTLRGRPRDIRELVGIGPPPDPMRVLLRETTERFKNATHYEVLELKEGATAAEIKKAYFEAAKRWHSDRFTNVDLGEDRDLLEDLFSRVNDANEILGNEEQRKNYDVFLDRKRKGLPTDVGAIMEADNLFRRGETLLARGNFEEALKDLQAAVKLNSGEPDFWICFAFAEYMVRGSEVTASTLKTIDQYKAKSSKPGRIEEFLGRIYRAEGRLNEARQQFNKCLERDSRNVNAQRELRLMEMRSGKHDAIDRDSGAPASKENGGFLSKLFKK